MKTALAKDERIELRVTSADKKIFKRAQEISGDKSFSSFIVRIVKQHAKEILAKNNSILTSENDRKVFFDTVFNAAKPNQNLIDAAKKYKSESA